MPRPRRILTLAAGLLAAGCAASLPPLPPPALVATGEGVAGVKADVQTAQRAVTATLKTPKLAEVPKAYLTVAAESHTAALVKVDKVEASLASARKADADRAEELAAVKAEYRRLHEAWYVALYLWFEWWFLALRDAIKWVLLIGVAMGGLALILPLISPLGWGLAVSGWLNVLNPIGFVFKLIREVAYKFAGIKRGATYVAPAVVQAAPAYQPAPIPVSVAGPVTVQPVAAQPVATAPPADFAPPVGVSTVSADPFVTYAQ